MVLAVLVGPNEFIALVAKLAAPVAALPQPSPPCGKYRFFYNHVLSLDGGFPSL